MRPIYDINFQVLAAWLIPPKLRGNITIAYIKALISPIMWLYGRFRLYMEDVSYRTSITPQVCYLQKVLNDTFDLSHRRIQILDTPGITALLIHLEESNLPVITHQQGSGHDAEIPIIHDESSYDGIYDFVVTMPFQLDVNGHNRLVTILNTYKLAGKVYQIIYP